MYHTNLTNITYWKTSTLKTKLLAFLFRALEFPGLSLGSETGYPDWDFYVFHWFLQASTNKLLSRSLPIITRYHPLIQR